MESKICTSCKEVKLMDDFHNHKTTPDGKQHHCKSCIKIRKIKDKDKNRKTDKIYYENNKEIIFEYMKDWRNNNPLYYKNCWNKEKYLITQKIWRSNNKLQINERVKNYNKERRKNDPIFRLYCSVSSRIKNGLKSINEVKSKRTQEILGCTFIEFKQYIELLWKPWMTWDNYGLYNGELNYGWDLDHKIPISSAKTEEEILKLNNFSNLQPLCSKINRNIKRANENFKS